MEDFEVVPVGTLKRISEMSLPGKYCDKCGVFHKVDVKCPVCQGKVKNVKA